MGAAQDAVGVVIDTAAAIVPGVPGGAGSILEAGRIADAAKSTSPKIGQVLDAIDANGIKVKINPKTLRRNRKLMPQ